MKKNYKDLFFDIESGELRTIKPDTNLREDISPIITITIDQPVRLLERPEANGITSHSYSNSERVPTLSLGVTHKFLDENCLKPGAKCERFKAASYSDGRIHMVMCRNGPFKRCQEAKGGR